MGMNCRNPLSPKTKKMRPRMMRAMRVRLRIASSPYDVTAYCVVISRSDEDVKPHFSQVGVPGLRGAGVEG
jgi:hypothetical protein